jgi:hypothetical protein
MIKVKAEQARPTVRSRPRASAETAFRIAVVWLPAVRITLIRIAIAAAFACWPLAASAQNCQTSEDMGDTARAAITAAGQRYFEMAAKNDAASLRQNAIASLSSDFSSIETTLKDHQSDLAGAQATVKSVFLLEAEGPGLLAHGEFFCGVFGKNGQTPTSTEFQIDNLPPGKYGVVLLEAASLKGKTSFSLVLQQSGADWKLAGLYLQPAQIAGHDSAWFAARAREYKTKGQLHNAWLFFLEARSLISPLPFMSTLASDKLYEEFQSMQPADVPANGKTADLSAGAVTYKLTGLFPQPVGNDLDLVVKYQVADASNANQAYQTNFAVSKALVTKYPELRDAFAAIVARAVDSSGRDYGTLLAMKDIK